MKVVTVAEMQALDRQTINSGIPGYLLMYQAAKAAFDEVLNWLKKHSQSMPHIRVLTGKGNNGGDGWVLARLLHQAGFEVSLYSICYRSELKGDADHHARRLPRAIAVYEKPDLPRFSSNDLIIDCLLGTGFKGELRPNYKKWIDTVNKSSAPCLAIDIPSGLDGNSGAISSTAVKADLTVTMAQPKSGLVSGRGLEFCGTLKCVDIGIPAEFIVATEGTGEAVMRQDATLFLQSRSTSSDTHKKSFGTVTVLAGCKHYGGAPMLTAIAALRSGCGYIRLLYPEQTPIFHSVHSLLYQEVPTTNGFFCKENLDTIEKVMPDSSVIVFGPGIGREAETTAVLEWLCNQNKPLVLDADALWHLSQFSLDFKFSAPAVLTPHPGEFKRLSAKFLPELNTTDRNQMAVQLAQKLNAVVVLKGLGTVIASPDGKSAVNTSGNEALSTAGSGDVLAGMIGAFMAEAEKNSTLSPLEATKAAVYLHGALAELPGINRRSFTADDQLDLISEVIGTV